MKKIILSFAILALGAFTFNASADNNNTPDTKCKARTECCGKCDGKKDGKKDGKMDGKKAGKKGGKKHGKRGGECCKGGKHHSSLFEGITLTAEQQTKLDSLREARKADRKRAHMNKNQGQSQSLDDIKKAREARDEMRAKSRKEFTQQVQQILTPEQFTVFQQNLKKQHDSKKESRAPRK